MKQENHPTLSQPRKYKIFTDSLEQRKTKINPQTLANTINFESDSRNSFRNTQRLTKMSIFSPNNKQKRCFSVQNNHKKAYSYNITNHITTEPCSNLFECNLLGSEKSQTDQVLHRKRNSIFGQNHGEKKNQKGVYQKLNVERKSIFGQRTVEKRNQSVQINRSSQLAQLDNQQEPKELRIHNLFNQGKKDPHYQTKNQFMMSVISQLPQKQSSKIQEPQENLQNAYK